MDWEIAKLFAVPSRHRLKLRARWTRHREIICLLFVACHLLCTTTQAQQQQTVASEVAAQLTLGEEKKEELKAEGFSISFNEEIAQISGAVPSEEVGQEIARAIMRSRPDTEIESDRLEINPEMRLPDTKEICRILTEIGISTHHGRFAVDQETISIGGLTDSMVTVAAILIRMETLLRDRDLINQICIVPSEDLPDIPIYLSDGKIEGPLLDFDPIPSAEEAFEIPGIVPAKLNALVYLASDMQLLETGKPSPPQELVAQTTAMGQIRAVPAGIGAAAVSPAGANEPEAPPIFRIQAVPAQPKIETRELNPIHFSRNTLILGANQSENVKLLAMQLKEAPFEGNKVIVRAMQPDEGSDTFSKWLCQRRADEVRHLLANLGVRRTTIHTEIRKSNEAVDRGEVRLFVKVPVKPPEENTEEPAEGPAPPQGPHSEKAIEKKAVATPVIIGRNP